MDPKIKRLSDTGMGILLLFLGIFALVTLFFGQPYLAAAEAAVLVILLVYSILAHRARAKQLTA